MINKIFFSFFIIFLTLVFTACSSSKPVSSTSSNSGNDRPARSSSSIEVQNEFHNAVTAKLLGNKEEAILLFRKVLRLDPKNDAAMYELARLLLEQGKLNEASPLVKEALKLDPENFWYKSINAEVLIYEGNFNEAANIYKGLIKQDPMDIEAHFDLAFVYERAKNHKEAINAYNKVEELVGLDEGLVLQKQRLYLKQNNISGAAKEIQKLIDAYPDNTRYYGMLAEMYETNGMSDKAFEVYQQLISKDPDNPYGSMALANHYLTKGDKAKYLENIKKAFASKDLHIDLKVAFLYEYIDKLKEDEEKKNEAIMLADLMINAHGEEAKAFALYGDILYNAEMPEKALVQYQNSFKYNNSVFPVWQQVMFIYSDLREFDSLLNFSQEAIELFPNQPIAYFFNGLAKNQLKKYDSAIKVFDQALLMSSSNKMLMAEIYSNLGDVYNSLSNFKLSDENFEKSLSINPNNAYVLNNYSYYLSLRNDKLDKAEEMASKANALIPNNSAFQDTYGWVLYKKGKYDQAKEWILKSIQNGGDSKPVILEHYGDVLFKLGNKNQALEYWQKAINNGGDSEVLKKKVKDKQLYE